MDFFQLLELVPVARWWPQLLKFTAVKLDAEDHPVVRFWQPVAAPPEHEALSRERMRTSGNATAIQRSFDANPVEGPSEIDVTFEGRTYLAYVEAKLGSDISLTTTYNPERNQIVRNIDCVLESFGRRRPIFWMFVRDRQRTRTYTQLMDRYRIASEMTRSLQHRPAVRLEEVASGLAVVT